MSFFKTYALWLLLPILGVLFGKLATTANPMVIGMGVSSFAGIALLRKPDWNVELVIVLGLLAGLMPLFFDALATKVVWGIAILGFMLLFAAFYRVLTTRGLIKTTPAFIWVALLFFIYSLVDSFLQLYSAKEVIGGFKRYYQVWGLMFGLCWLNFDKHHIDRWRNVVLIIGLLQVPFCLYELLFIVPDLEGLVEIYTQLVPIDVVAGTFGASKNGGGNSAEMAIVLIIMFGFLLSRYKSNVTTGKEFFTVSLVLLSPLAMGETKIIIIFFPMMFATVYRKELISRPHYLIAALIFGSLFTVIAVGVNMMMTKMTLDQLIDDTLRYNVYEVGYGGLYLNRTTVLSFWAQHQGLSDPVSFLFGSGLGSAQPGDAVSLGGHLDTRFLNYGIGFTGAGLLLWELGIFGVTLFLLMMAMAWRCANQLIAQSVDPMVRADALAIQAGLLLFSFYPLYLSALFSEFGFQVIFTFMLGYLAWMYKQHSEYKS
ncbi:MAG: hypothetical protein Q8N30_00825 [Methylococcales bacterium]|nr:hypothetical protein [Methylococcales bacterium]